MPQSVLAGLQCTYSTELLTDLSTISQYWGTLTPYSDNPPDHFGVQDVGVPSGCQLEQAHLLQRHANRFPSGWDYDGVNGQRFAQKVAGSAPTGLFTGPLEFLNTYQYELSGSVLTGLGASAEFQAGVTFWNRYGRTLYNASAGQLALRQVPQWDCQTETCATDHV